MTPELRAAIAAICIADRAGAPVAAVYDHEAAAGRAMEAEVVGVRAVCCDRASGETLGGDLPELWHAASGAWVHVGRRDAGGYDGYDRTDGSAFAVEVAGLVAQVFDHASGTWRAYTGQLSTGAF